ncbi:threonine dehydrogenase-like Zn-dependent dehydrogenase [Microbacterium terrae]|uniref:2-deoxy-scyllo-inosamine dehydrogenase n=1 Tax=Microbacterium terrae TaxID=69369 RepID=A0A0M2H0J1_9MICO|nr:alcohol dehydrogenase catalytic domain-containing protein [Microbacterium terrae]KJL37530.1 2-deoxy-scyllo-inosamine dehydrogenase [Microbacterium terrae]MBP1076359.1 threonine dehydrogenase-like Zn-dependent dehydrogenase [Microbacterium terrae]GLJ97183.1 alcohol dehydrogenase [Microbacterium terrae]
MKALVITGPHQAEVQDVEAPVAAPGEVVVDVKRAGICGTDMELFTGEMAYYETRHTSFPVRIGHEWMGVVSQIGDGVDAAWLGARVTGDTMLGCGECRRCLQGLQHVCEFRGELGIRDGRPGALAEQVAVPVTSLHRLPDTVDDATGAMVEPGGNAFRSVEAAGLKPGDRCLVLGPGTIGLLCGLFAKAAGAEVHLLGRSERSLAFARTIGFEHVWTEETLPDLPWDAVIEASNAQHLPAKAVDLVEPGKRVVYVGLAGTPSLVDTRDLALKDVSAVGILSASPGLAGTITSYASGAVDPRPLIADTLTLADLPAILAGERPAGSGAGPKFHVSIGE